MQDKDEICLCFHVSRKKLVNFVRVERPQRASQLSQCFGAGTGCGWCRPFLEAIFRAETEGNLPDQRLNTLTADEYARLRKKYRKQRQSE